MELLACILHHYTFVLYPGHDMCNINAQELEAASSLHCQPTSENWPFFCLFPLSEIDD